MAKQIKAKVGRPKLPKGEAKGRIVPIRLNPQDVKRVEAAARASQKTVSEWIRGAITSAMGTR
jgi:predicted HicB family RNase H-like nuclease